MFLGKDGKAFQTEGPACVGGARLKREDGQHYRVQRARIPRSIWASEGDYFPKNRFPGSGLEIETPRVEPECPDFKKLFRKVEDICVILFSPRASLR